MKRLYTLLVIILCTIQVISAQQTYIPDDNFEQALIDLSYDTVLDDSVLTSNISLITHLTLVAKNIFDLTGIEDFISLEFLVFHLNYVTELDISNNISLTHLGFHHNNISSIDVSNNINLKDITAYNNNLSVLDLSNNADIIFLNCENNNLANLNLKSGNNTILSGLYLEGNPLLDCILVDDSIWSVNHWINIDSQHYFSGNCSGTVSVNEIKENNKLLRVINVLGRNVKETTNTPLFYIYDDGTVEKKIVVK